MRSCSSCCFRSYPRRPQALSLFFFLMIRRPPRSTLDRSSAASDVYKRQRWPSTYSVPNSSAYSLMRPRRTFLRFLTHSSFSAVSYTHLRAHETVLDLVCRLLLEKKKTNVALYTIDSKYTHYNYTLLHLSLCRNHHDSTSS